MGTSDLKYPATDSKFHITAKQLQFILLRIFESAYGNSLSHLSTNVSEDDNDHAPTGSAVYTAIIQAMENARDNGAAMAKVYTDAVAKELAASIPDQDGGLRYEIVGMLPALPVDNTIYFKLDPDADTYIPYIFIGGKWMTVGGNESATTKKPIDNSRLDDILTAALA